MRLAWKMLLRDSRAGELWILALAVVISVAAMSTVGFFSERVRLAMEQQADRILGADLQLDADHPLQEKFAQKAVQQGLAAASVIRFPSMVSGGKESLLSEIKAVSRQYPLKGDIKISRSSEGSAGAFKGLPPAGSVWADRKLLARLGLNPGDRLEIGDGIFRIDAAMEEEPDEMVGFFTIGPRVLMNLQDLDKTRLLETGSRVRYLLLLAGNVQAVKNYRLWAEKNLARGEKIEGIRDSRPEIRQMLDRGSSFLGSSALMSVVLAAAAIFLAARRFSERHLDGSAVMRVLGISEGSLFRLYLVYFVIFSLATSLVGSAIGFLAQSLLSQMLATMLETPLPAPTLAPLFKAMAGGMLLLLGFSLPPVMALSRVSAMRVFRREEGGAVSGFFWGFISLFALFLWQAENPRSGLLIFGGFLAALLVFALLGNLSLVFCRGGAGPWRLGIANLRRRRVSSLLQIVAFALGLMALLLLTLIREDLLSSWRASLPADAPNRFLLNIRHEQLPQLSEFFAQKTDKAPEIFPMVKGRLVAINDKAVSPGDYPELRARRLASREFNLSWRDSLPADNKILQGNWWKKTDAGKAWLSVEDGIAKTLGIRLHDRLTFEVAGRMVSAEVVSLRQVAWDSFRVNFFVLAPPGIFDAYPASYITSFYLPENRYAEMNELVRAFPNVLLIDVSSILAKVQKMMAQAAKAVEFVFVFSLLAGATVLYAAFAATQDERIREAAILRTLGASRRQLYTMHAAEFLLLGGISGLFAAIGASAVGFLLAKKLLDIPFVFDPAVMISGIVSGALGVTFLGLLASRRLMSTAPASVLRRL